ncbi:hypothetical protein [Kitasatospora sp. NPDC050543]|uniref:hypothetical protein n=1 Tax=Kitasatospora sp. NPDC050543 TaxID=3364054 RepID=UPI00379B1971
MDGPPGFGHGDGADGVAIDLAERRPLGLLAAAEGVTALLAGVWGQVQQAAATASACLPQPACSC